jgi:hypothetical protein
MRPIDWCRADGEFVSHLRGRSRYTSGILGVQA